MTTTATWTTDVDGDYVFPKDLVLDPDESSEASVLLGDIRTHISHAFLQFVVGDRSLDEFQAFRDELQAMGMDRVLEIYQAAFTKYLED